MGLRLSRYGTILDLGLKRCKFQNPMYPFNDMRKMFHHKGQRGASQISPTSKLQVCGPEWVAQPARKKSRKQTQPFHHLFKPRTATS